MAKKSWNFHTVQIVVAQCHCHGNSLSCIFCKKFVKVAAVLLNKSLKSWFDEICGKMRNSLSPKIFRQINSLVTYLVTVWKSCEKRDNAQKILSNQLFSKKVHLTEKMLILQQKSWSRFTVLFHTVLVKLLLSRKFCQKCMREFP